ncbi:2-oxoglutarate-FeII type oxidoreductase-like protein isoform X1 [Cinnamomum micranthum f. kanehirae]|uniref:2-oxoglutarate-FeII type oxidoreductase-like protein isoform X1 n=1 Tax=Cinnamomum micranthum f. kanehirae TaxID=337451 RepID=A0A443PNM0_9MAGN|nr:2-oxoglutarate-FeII type oxidoreductase-like protein isoform X1 [Cinnamomum micranthum f. kanehirae]
MAGTLQLPTIDLSSPDQISNAKSIRQACLDHGFFYVVNHGVDDELLKGVFEKSGKFFLLPLQEKMKLTRSKDHRGYTALYSETLDPSIQSKGDLHESFYIGPVDDDLNQWPAEDALPCWRPTMELYHKKMVTLGWNLISLIALALNLDEDFFEKVGAMHAPWVFMRLLHYPVETSDIMNYGASAHSDYGMITILATDGVPGLQAYANTANISLIFGILQICKEKDKQPRVWEDVLHVNGAFIVNIGDMMERWTNCLFRSTLHRVMTAGQERYSVFPVAFFVDPNPDCIVECLESCCSDTCPPKFPPIRSQDYLEERFRMTYALKG